MSNEDRYADFFCPPLWRQRRIFIKDMLTRFNVKSVLDYGCGEAAVLSFLIPDNNDTCLVKMAGIDICDESLAEAVDRCTPWQTDHEQLRSNPLVLDIYKGSIGVVDDRLFGYEAIICTEVIEHVYADTLNSFLDITLGIYQPQILIVTTPNGEYNVNFPQLKYGTEESIFRHDDHKFEWTRNEFETWCNNGADKYGYTVEYHGIGLLHGKHDELKNGHCTQACIFVRSNVIQTPTAKSYGTPHQLLKHNEFPYFNEPALPKEKIMQELLHYVQSLCISETYLQTNNNQDIKKEEKELLDINLTAMDWDTFNLEDVIPDATTTTTDEPYIYKKTCKYTTIPLNLPISSLWSILRLRQICLTIENMLHLLSLLDNDKYELVNQTTLQVKTSFEFGS
ncbi:hypothetical protein EDC94DRAFT_318715 [Helicostylum pulchrum]|nr:hypothetical protein EDC94DRAFT_318715 [Helicostylum pulchrum]